MMERTTASTMPCSTPQNTTMAAVMPATTNSSRRMRSTRRMPAMSTRSMPITNTTLASAQFGRYSSGLVANRITMRTTPAVVSIASWLRPPAPSTISVLVGLPFTTNVPPKPATMFAAPSARTSRFSSTRSR